ncbi:MAG: TIGR03857 family LLM class F420-dependent oxidoreductase [Acidimicrobiia bacterium]
MSRSVDRLGCYVLPGGVRDPLAGLDQARAAERLGFGTIWIGERYDTKDLPSLAGAISQITSRPRIAAGVTHPGLRHPMVLASMGQTLQALSAERFVLGIGRSAAWRWRQYGAPAPTLASLGDTANILRRLWAGETVSYEGPLGTFPELRLAQRADVAPPPIILAAVGPATLALAGRSFDGVMLHPFLTPAAVRASIGIVREAARTAGRDADALRCYATVVVAPDRSPEDAALAVGARAAGYFQLRGLGDALAAANGWAEADLERYRAQPKLAALGERSADKTLTRDELVEVSRAMPPDWLPSSSAVGDSDTCAARLEEYLESGADELVLHGSTAEHLGGLAAAFGARPG